MQFTPNIKERYAAGLREIITRRILKGENTPKNKKLLKIILVFSHLCRNEIKENINLLNSIENLLKVVALKYNENQKSLTYDITGRKNYEIDYELLKLLVLESVFNPTQIKVRINVKLLESRIIFTVQNAKPSKILKCLIKKGKGILINEKTGSNFAIMLPVKNVLHYENFKEKSEDYSDPFSALNIMLFQ